MTDNGTKEETLACKILLLGDSTVGKTSFILRFCEDKFDDGSITTIGLDQKTKYVKRGGKKIELHIWDTAGQERFRSIAKNLFKSAHGILLMYDVTNLNSFNDIKNWINNIQESVDISKIALIVVGNKIDLPDDEKKVNEGSRKSFEDSHKMKIIEASAKTNKNVNESFIALIDRMVELGLGKKKSSEDDEDGNKKLSNSKRAMIKEKCCTQGKKK
jgi:Ras-related protein Rab-1A